MSFTDTELAGLGDEERAALADEMDDTESSKAAEASVADETPIEAAADTADDPIREPEPFIPRYQAELPADFEAQLAAIGERKKALRTQYQDGNLELDDYEDARDGIESEALALREAHLKATLASEQAQQTATQRWQWEQERFFTQKANAVYRADPILGSAFDAAVKGLARDPAHEGKPMSWFLDEADRVTRERMRSVVGAPETPTKTPSAPIKTRPAIPPNLGDLPSADLPETGGDEWAHLDRLQGMDIEAALAKLSPAEQERYLRG